MSDKIKYEAMWNELIFQKYSSFIKIDENELKNQLIEKSSKVKNLNINYQKFYTKLKIMAKILKIRIKLFLII